MPTQLEPVTVTGVNEQMGARFRARRAALRMTQEAIAARAEVDPDTVSRLESGKPVRVANAGAIDKALTDLERERGVDLPSQVATVEARPIGDPDEGLIQFEVGNDAGIRVVVKGPVANLAELQASALRLARELGRSDEDTER